MSSKRLEVCESRLPKILSESLFSAIVCAKNKKTFTSSDASELKAHCKEQLKQNQTKVLS